MQLSDITRGTCIGRTGALPSLCLAPTTRLHFQLLFEVASIVSWETVSSNITGMSFVDIVNLSV